MNIRCGLGGRNGGDFEVCHLGFDAGSHLVADGRRVGEYLDRVGGVRDVVRQFVGEELAEFLGDGGGGESGVDGADRAVEVEQQVAGAGDDRAESGVVGAEFVHVGRHVRISESALADFIEAGKVPPLTAANVRLN